MSSQLSDLVEVTKDPLVLAFVWANLGKAVPHDACFTDTIMHIRRKVLHRLLGGPGHHPHHALPAHVFWQRQQRVWVDQMARLERKQREMIEDHLTTALLDVQERDLTTVLFRQSSIERFIHKLAEGGPDLLRQNLRNDDPVARLLVVLTIARQRVHLEKELIERLNDPHPAVRQAVHGTLVRLARGTDFGPVRNVPQPGIARCADRWREWLSLQESEALALANKSKPTLSIARPSPLDIEEVIVLPRPSLSKTIAPGSPNE